MDIKIIDGRFTLCKLKSASGIDLNKDFIFVGKTDEEISLVCRTDDTPADTTDRDDDWRAFRIEGTLDFSLIGILAKISSILAESKIGIFAISTYNTDYILVKTDNFDSALAALTSKGYTVV